MRFQLFGKIVVTMLTLYVIQLFSPVCSAQSFPVPGNSNHKWTDTMLDLKPGTLVQLAAKGEVDVGAGWGVYGPEGTRKFADVPGYPAETTYRYGLVARVTQSRTNPDDDLREQWSYGERREFCARHGGHLWLTVNDDQPKDNNGEFVVDISVGPCAAESTTVSELRGRFRVTLNGFTVERQTNEQENLGTGTSRRPEGRGDEVYLRGDVFVLEGTGRGGFRIQTHRSVRSIVFGDTSGFPDREQAGTSSSTGGLRSGDSYPGSRPWLRLSEPRADRLPLLLWEGELRDSRDGMSVIVIPTIWEWDEPGPGEFSQALDEQLYPYMLDVFTRYGPRFDAQDAGPVFQTFLPLTWFRARETANIPIGRSFEQMIADGRVVNSVEYSFNMGEVNLTFRTASELARTRFEGASGITKVVYADRWITGDSADANTASYTLYLQIERVN